MPKALREQARRRRQAYTLKWQNQLRFQEAISRILRTTNVRKASFGAHWQWMHKNLHEGNWNIRDLIRACAIVKKLPKFGLHHLLVKEIHWITIVGNPNHLKANAWLERAEFMLKGLRLMIKKNRKALERRAYRKTKASAHADHPRSPIVGDEIDRNNDTAVSRGSLGLSNTQTGRDGRWWENSGESVSRTHIPFPGGRRSVPEFFVCPSTEVRANFQADEMELARSTMISQLPHTIPSDLRQTIIHNIQRTNVRKPPSALPLMSRIRKASKTDEDEVALTDVVQGLAHAHWVVFQEGTYGFFWRHLRHLRIEAVTNYNFDWSNIRGTNVLDSHGQELRIHAGTPASMRAVARRR